MRMILYKKLSLGLILSLFLFACEDFLEVEAPNHKIITETVFSSDQTALSAMTGIYNELFNAQYSSGGPMSITSVGALSADNLKLIKDNLPRREFEQNEVSTVNSYNLSLWSSAYRTLYMTNALLEGLESSDDISEPVQTSLEGEAKFIRAFTYFYLLNLYGEVPLLLTTDYRHSSLATQVGQQQVYEQILLDLIDAESLLVDDYRDSDRKHVNRFVAVAMLARVNLYLENWAEAERLSSLVLSSTSIYELKEDLNKTFLANSKEALWQLSPMGSGGINSNTNEARLFLDHPTISFLSTSVGLTDELVLLYDEEDKRFNNWIGYSEIFDNYFPYKYKIYASSGTSTEYSMVLRLAEQYLIRAEARARQGDNSGAIADINTIRERAGLTLLSDMTSQLGNEQILELIFEERRKELFTEWGHRWLDLKRTGMATDALSEINPLWESTDVFYPIPEEERIKNPNLGQNAGY